MAGVVTYLFNLLPRSWGLSLKPADQSGQEKVKSTWKASQTSRSEWDMNASLLMHVHDQTQDVHLKKEIEFLALQYLAKAATFDYRAEVKDSRTLEYFQSQILQGVFTKAHYYREGNQIEKMFQSVLRNFSLAVESGYITDNTDFASLLGLLYVELKGTDKEIEDRLFQVIVNSRSRLEYLLVDLTDELKDLVLTGEDPERQAKLNAKKVEIKKRYEEILSRTISRLNIQEDQKDKWKDFLSSTLIFICRTEIKGICLFLPIPDILQSDPSHLAIFSTSIRIILENYVDKFGLRLGAVAARRNILDFIPLEEVLRGASHQAGLPQIPRYDVAGANALVVKNKEMVLQTALFKRFEERMQSETPSNILGKATAKLIRGLFEEMDQKRWENLMESPSDRMLLQQTIFRMLEHLAMGELKRENFTEFTKMMELIHYEMGTLLALTAPFEKGSFSNIYRQNITAVPPHLAGCVQVGLTRSAMHAFSGIAEAARSTTAEHKGVTGGGIFFEQEFCIGRVRLVDRDLGVFSPESTCLIAGEFDHNIDVHLTRHHYAPSDLKLEIETVLSKNRGRQTNPKITVAVDCTVDYLNSSKVKELLQHFDREIQNGILNFVFYRSGQKFDMLGMDNYYGAPFWMVNNGAEHWAPFKKLFSPSHHTDSLTYQWFCLVNKYAAESIEEYKGQIFSNTRMILDGIPSELQQGGKYAKRVRISTVDQGMNGFFLDIKLLDRDWEEIKDYLFLTLSRRFAGAKSLITLKGSFGFRHANWNETKAIEDEKLRNIRINPGLDPKENAIILDWIRFDIPRILDEVLPSLYQFSPGDFDLSGEILDPTALPEAPPFSGVFNIFEQPIAQPEFPGLQPTDPEVFEISIPLDPQPESPELQPMNPVDFEYTMPSLDPSELIGSRYIILEPDIDL